MYRPIPKKDQNKPNPVKGRCALIRSILTREGFGQVLEQKMVLKFVKENIAHRDKGVRNDITELAKDIYLIIGAQKMNAFVKELSKPQQETLQKSFKDADAEQKSGKHDKFQNDLKAKHANDITKHAVEMQQRIDYEASVKLGGPPKSSQTIGAAGGASSGAGGGAGGVLDHKNQPSAIKARGKSPPKKMHSPLKHKTKEPVDEPNQRTGDTSFDNKEEEEDDEGFCQFCGEENPEFTEELLELHFWQSCPVLTACALCEEIVEVPTLVEHMLEECERKEEMKQCDRCKQAIKVSEHKAHVKAKKCTEAKGENVVPCPLCKELLQAEALDENEPNGPTQVAWREHLTKHCRANSRIQVE